jgi:hypothetical protein
MSITFSTAWYVFKAKFDVSTYSQWIDNMLSNVNNYYLVIYTDQQSSQYVDKYSENPRIKIIIKSYEEFYTYRYRDNWIANHENNLLLRDKVDWKLNMLWSEKIHFVYETTKHNGFGTEWFGWCDIGYFRGRPDDLSSDALRDWPSASKINSLNKSKIHYACVNNNMQYLSQLLQIIIDKNDVGLPFMPIPAHQVSIAGGFFISHIGMIEWWRKTFDEKLALYFEHGYLVKDDQIVIADCVFSNLPQFELLKENVAGLDNWFLFQRALL